MAERFDSAGAALAARLRRGRQRLLQPVAHVRRLTARAPKQFLLAPQDIRTADPTVADAIHAGHYAFAGRIVDARGRSPFTLLAPSTAWTQALASFDWLRHLRAADTPSARGDARMLVGDWIRTSSKVAGPAWEPWVVARRLMAWLSQSPVILNEADYVFYRRFMQSVGHHTVYLQQVLAGGLEGEQRLFVAIALAAVGLCAEGMPAVERRGSRLLGAELARQILPDGGHIGRNPRLLCDLLLDLLPLRQAYVGRGVQAPEELSMCIDRMLPMLRLFRHGDGALALFNGMGVTAPDVLATLFAYDDTRAPPTMEATRSGYRRLEAENVILIIDVGAPPPPVFSEAAHAGCLAFELSIGAQRVVVNCGAPSSASRTDLRDAARATAAHSTLVVADASSCRFVTAPRLRAIIGARVLDGPRTVTCDVRQDASGTTLEASHDGYAAGFGVVHRRSLQLAADGRGLRGRDGLQPAGDQARAARPEHALRFHLHPSVRAALASEAPCVELRLNDGSLWLFEADRPPTLEDSIFFAATEGICRSRQIVVRVAADGARDGVAWSLTRRT